MLLWALICVFGQLEHHAKDAGGIAVLVLDLCQEVLDEVVQKGLEQLALGDRLVAWLSRFNHYYKISE